MRALSSLISCTVLAVAACGGNPSVGRSGSILGSGGTDTGASGVGGTTGPIIIEGNPAGQAGTGGNGGQTVDPCIKDPKASGCTPPECGDSKISGKEQCDDGNADGGDGCSANCALENGFECLATGVACKSTVVCGDGRLGGKEVCDDRNTDDKDGCSRDCSTVEPGWTCSVVGAACTATRCGDGIIAGTETCDDGNDSDKDGCTKTCGLQEGYACPEAGAACTPTRCGDGKAEGTEQCEDSNTDTGDGCSPLCKFEPVCKDGTCQARCGDGLKLASEDCDDGNTTSGDGCSGTCTIENGFTCKIVEENPVLPVVYRDFIGSTDTGDDTPVAGNTGPIHLDFQYYNGCTEVVESALDVQGKPVLKSPAETCVGSADSFATWYRSDPAVNRTVVDTLTLSPVTGTPRTFEYFDETFFPLTGRGWNDPLDLKEVARNDSASTPQNFHFTSELRYWFTYQGGEKLTFFGDDDVWVFINRNLAVDIAGVHGRLQRWVQLPGPDGKPAGGTGGDKGTSGIFDPATLGLQIGGIYEVVVYQAERHTAKSQYKLTLENFLSARSKCDWLCGDGVVTRFEVCDDGKNDGSYGSCQPDCMAPGPRCGDNHVDTDAGEACDDGINRSPYNGCGPNCQLASSCGDGKLDSLFGETCDDGTEKNTGAYGACGPDCRKSLYCGDHILQAGEDCDDGNGRNGDGCDTECRFEVIQ